VPTDVANSLPELAEGQPPTAPFVVKRAPWYVRFAVVMALFGCLAGMAWAFSLNQDEKQPDGKVLEVVSPPAGSKAVPGQSPVSADLIYGYEAELMIDGKPIEQKFIVERAALGQFTFTPGVGKPYERFENGPHVASVVYWPKVGSKVKDGVYFEWNFTVV
jgi:hypothetical protein